MYIDLTHCSDHEEEKSDEGSDHEPKSKRSRHGSPTWMPFYLLKLRCLDDHYAQNCLSFSDLVAPGARCILFLNYKVDIEWMISECPFLKVSY